MLRRYFKILGIILIGSPAVAEGFVLDAFGIVPTELAHDERQTWAGARLVSGQFEKQEPNDVENVVFFSGPKSLVAGKETGELSALGTDIYGNLVSDGKLVEFKLGALETMSTVSRNGLGSVFFPAPEKAGTYLASASLAGRQSVRATFRVTADLGSLTFDPLVAESAPRPETLIELKSNHIRDQFGNVVSDGVATSVLVNHTDGSATMLSARAIDGTATGTLLIRDLAITGRLIVSIGPKTAEARDFSIIPYEQSDTSNLNLWRVPEMGAIGLEIGPFETESGHLLPDGAPVSVLIQSASGRSSDTQGWLQDGMFSAIFAIDAADGPFDIQYSTALGTYRHKRSIQTLRTFPQSGSVK